jgi:ABC-type antimicrobial peptide transport system permease subunit
MLGVGDSTQTPWLTVVGIVGDVKHESLDSRGSLDVYLPFEQTGAGGAYLLLKTSTDPRSLARAAPQLVWQVDPNQSFFDVRTMRDRVADRVWIPRLAGVLFAGFAILASVLGAIGVFAVLAYAVSQRTRELGVRQALGASPGDLARLVVRDGMTLAGAGTTVGLVVALGIAFGMRQLLFSVSPFDVPTLIGAPAMLLIVAAAACWIPGRRATHVSPADALRSDI